MKATPNDATITAALKSINTATAEAQIALNHLNPLMDALCSEKVATLSPSVARHPKRLKTDLPKMVSALHNVGFALQNIQTRVCQCQLELRWGQDVAEEVRATVAYWDDGVSIFLNCNPNTSQIDIIHPHLEEEWH